VVEASLQDYSQLLTQLGHECSAQQESTNEFEDKAALELARAFQLKSQIHISFS